MEIVISEICDKKTVTRDDGGRINKIISSNWKKEKKFIIDFDNTLVASVSFMDEAFGKLALSYSKDDIKAKLKLENIGDYDRSLLNDILVSRFRQKELGHNGASKH